MRIEDALSQVRTIQRQVARTEQYCCYRWATVAGSGLIGLAAAAVQSRWVASPLDEPARYVAWWVAVATINVSLVGAEVLLRWRRSESDYTRRQTSLAVRQFAPCLVVGALVTLVVLTKAPQYVPLFPALWSVCFSLGICASLRHFPAGGVLVAGHYLLAGLACVIWSQGDEALHPWTMAATFGVGQLLSALVLFRQKESTDGST